MRDNVPEATRRKIIEGRRLAKNDLVDWQRILNKKGWAVPNWPKEWGGTGWNSVKRYIFQRRDAAGAGARAARLRRQHGWAGDHHLRQQCAEKEIPAAHRQSR